MSNGLARPVGAALSQTGKNMNSPKAPGKPHKDCAMAEEARKLVPWILLPIFFWSTVTRFFSLQCSRARCGCRYRRSCSWLLLEHSRATDGWPWQSHSVSPSLPVCWPTWSGTRLAGGGVTRSCTSFTASLSTRTRPSPVEGGLRPTWASDTHARKVHRWIGRRDASIGRIVRNQPAPLHRLWRHWSRSVVGCLWRTRLCPRQRRGSCCFVRLEGGRALGGRCVCFTDYLHGSKTYSMASLFARISNGKDHTGRT